VRKKILRIVLIVVVVVPAVAMVLHWRGLLASETRTYQVTTGNLLSGVTVSGSIRCRQRVPVSSEVLASVKVVAVEEGRSVSAGQVLVELDDSVVAAEQAKAEARLELARQQLAEFEAGAREEELNKAREALRRTQSDIDFSTKEHARLERARELGVATESELNQAANQMEKAQADLEWARANLRLLEAGVREEQIARSRAEVSLAEADLQRILALHENYTLRAPHEGIVTVKYVNVGEIVSPGQVLLHVENLNDIEVRAQVQEAQLQGVRKGSRARVLADAYPDTPLEAVVERILPRVDPEQGTVTVLLELAQAPPVMLMDGMAADIAVIDAESSEALRVPVSAIEKDGDEAYVRCKEGGSFARRTVEVGISDGYWIEVKSGLKSGDVVRIP
jgi:HlyD family secretion protein